MASTLVAPDPTRIASERDQTVATGCRWGDEPARFKGLPPLLQGRNKPWRPWFDRLG
jgi:hypothetical protein